MNKDAFFGHKPYLDTLEKRIRGLKEGYRQNIAFIGDELIGKTSTIFRLLNKFSDNHIITLYLETRAEPLESFARRFIGVLLYNFLSNSGIALEENLDFLIKKSQRYAPLTVEKIKLILEALKKRKKNNIFTQLLSLCETINQETKKSCVVILDEFHNLESLGIKDLYREWAKVLISQKNTMYIIVSSSKFKAKAILSHNLSLLFGNFETITAEPFDIKTTKEYLEHKLPQLNLIEGIRDFIIHFTGGHPFYLEIISDALLKTDPKNLADTLEKLLFVPSGILNQRFTNYLKRFQNTSADFTSILYLIAGAHNKIKEIMQLAHKQKKELLSRINRLVELDAIVRNGDFLKINDRVFGFWLRFVYQEKLNSLTFNAQNQKAIFRDSIDGMIKDFILKSQMPITERLMELLRLFEDETIQIERKKIRLEHFREIKPLEFGRGGLKNGLMGRSHDSLWIMALKDDYLSEEDIADFAKECKKYRHKLQKKIVISSCEIEANARLRALEEKILTWDINQLNHIFDLFSKPRVISV